MTETTVNNVSNLTLDPTTISSIITNSLKVVDFIAQRAGWTQVSNFAKYLEGLLNDPATLNALISLFDLLSKLSVNDVKNLVNVAAVALKK